MRVMSKIIRFKDVNDNWHSYMAVMVYRDGGWLVTESDLAEIEKIKNCNSVLG